MAYLTGWSWHKNLTLIGSADGVQAVYQIPVKIYRSAGTDGTETIEGRPGLKVYLGTDCEEDYDDIRFTEDDGETLLDYWIDPASVSSASCICWVEFIDFPASPDTVQFVLQYGNAGASPASSGVDTFIVFENFERGINNDAIGGDWTVHAGGVVISTDHAYGGTRCGKWVGAATPGNASIPITASDNIAIRFRIWKENAADLVCVHGDGTNISYWNFQADEDIMWHNGAALQDTGDNITADQWQLVEYNNFVWGTPTVDAWLNGTKIQDDADISFAFSHAWYNDALNFSLANTTAGVDIYIDDPIAMYWTANPPTLDSWGEKTANVTYTPTSPPCFDMAVL